MGERWLGLRSRLGLRPTPLIFGIAFLTLGILGLDGGADGETTWLWVTLLTAAGLAGLVVAIRAVMGGPADSD